nr:Chain P, Pre-glycoprotein polyprotein GP complex [Lymphocytic choriomeningitis virus (strain Armstrong)]5JWE_Q Chain Q, Pre-glycoprotein polyprotein GP complex [Lymphocytic choriomeningitis virus (strain Armstrong)]5JWE_R Chain R, Pre-glycoprotein polyprotein GP complex [Lymphocytic choriomeningitis virus (strain Armstrong)]5JWE_S Chain S, Pre-glycoprotein polyprotein GP complex [Lymphocytic choriomeningitis virus (strain Armstrong)]
CSANNSHHYI